MTVENMRIRTRFAPSPTGSLHMGSLRTIIFDYLIAKTEGSSEGKLILRIEDTDQKRKVEGAVEKMLEIIDWLGIKFDEGPHIGGEYGPYVQTERLDIYKKYVDELIETGAAYYCFCTEERLEKLRKEQEEKKLPPRYDRRCRNLSKEEAQERIAKGEPYVIRQKMPLEGEVVVRDELRGEIKVKASELDDQVLVKSNGIPTYHLASVVDDHLMEISHVLRGEEWLPSLPKNILLYQAFGWESPKFIHMTVSLNKGGGKLSKRHGDVSVEDFRAKGYLQEALINFRALMVLHPKGDNEIMTLYEIVKQFYYRDMGISSPIFDTEKLDYLNGYYIRQKSIDELAELCRPFLKENLELTSSENKKTDEFIKKVVKAEKERLKKLSEVGELTSFLFVDKINFDEKLLAWKNMEVKQAQKNLEKLLNILKGVEEEEWQEKILEEKIVAYLKENNLKVGEYLWPMRVALSGKQASPGPFEIAGILGKEETLKRIEKAIS